MAAASNGCIDSLRFVLKLGADPNMKSAKGLTALDMARAREAAFAKMPNLAAQAERFRQLIAVLAPLGPAEAGRTSAGCADGHRCGCAHEARWREDRSYSASIRFRGPGRTGRDADVRRVRMATGAGVHDRVRPRHADARLRAGEDDVRGGPGINRRLRRRPRLGDGDAEGHSEADARTVQTMTPRRDRLRTTVPPVAAHGAGRRVRGAGGHERALADVRDPLVGLPLEEVDSSGASRYGSPGR